MHYRNRILTLVCVLVLAGEVAGQEPRRTASAGQALFASLSDSSILAQLRPRSLGPAVMSGRISDIAVPLEAGARLGRVVYVASAGGGVWKTTNGGKSWQPVFDTEGPGSIGALAVAPSDPQTVWVGTGESNNLRSSSWGDGVYKSTDGGDTWMHMGLRESQHIGRIVVHPANADIVYVAATGPLWNSGGERGLFKTTDGGQTWTNVKSISASTGFTDVVLDPSNPDVVYGAAYQRERKAYSFVAGGPESGIWKSTDGGQTWRQLPNGLPATDQGRIGLTISPQQPRTLYAVVHADSGGVFRTDDGGESWRRTSSISSIPWFFGQIRVDPQDVRRVYFLGQTLQVSEDGGQNWRRIAANTHADHHAMWIDPHDSNHLIIGNDGGLYTSHDRGESWDFAVNLPVSTFYAIGVDMREPFYHVYGGLQDNGTWGGPVQTRVRAGITNSDWVRAGGGDGFYAAIDPTDPNVVYVESQNGNLRRVDRLTEESKAIRPQPDEGEPPYRFNWSAPLLISPHDHNTLYFAANYVFRSRDRGDSWERLGNDLTRALDRDTMPIMGFKSSGGLGRHEGTAPFGNIATIDESTLSPGLLWVGTDDGLVQVSRDGGATWTKIDQFPGVPPLTYVSRVIASQHAEGTAFATLDGHRSNDFKPYVLKTTDFGRTWRSITSNLPSTGSVHVIREHHRNPNLLFVGTEFGAFVTTNGGQSWAALHGLPVVAVHDLIVHPRENDLVIGTHGRGIWVVDDIAPLERLAEAAATRVAHVFTPRSPAIYNLGSGPRLPGDRDFTAANPPRGALLSYLVKAGVEDEANATLVIVDQRGEVVRELNAVTRPGLHRTAWDLRYASAVPPRASERAGGGDDEDEPSAFAAAAAAGPYVLPGEYRVQYRLSRRGQQSVAHEATVSVLRDPLVRLTDAQLAELQEWRMKVYHTTSEIGRTVRELEDAREDLSRLAAGADSAAAAAASVSAVNGDLDELLTTLRGQRRPGGGGRGAGGGGPGGSGRVAVGLQGRAQSALNEIATLHFPVTEAQKRAIDTISTDFDSEQARISDVRARIAAVLNPPAGRLPQR